MPYLWSTSALRPVLEVRTAKRNPIVDSKMSKEQEKLTNSAAIGCLYGQAIGDALGARYEFQTASQAAQMVKRDKKWFTGFLPILGGGRFSVIPGQVTDDTELAMCLCRSLLERKTYDKELATQNYIFWLKSHPFGVGASTRQAFYVLYSGKNPKF